MHLNIEIKARSTRHEAIKKILESLQADFRGIDHQIDTYFQCSNGRLKLREGNIEKSLIFYARSDQAGPKASEVYLHQTNHTPTLKETLSAAYGIWKVVDKKRRIYFVENVKFHLDEVKGLGTFVEIEAIDADGSIGEKALHTQCQHYMQLLGIQSHELISHSYSDMIDSPLS